MMEVKKVTVLGAGLMGHGIAQVAAQVGKYEVSLRDIKQEFIDKGMEMINRSLQIYLRKEKITKAEVNQILRRIHQTLDLKEAVSDADLIVEAAPEKVEIKKSIFSEVDKLAQKDALIVSNTSSISITDLASATKRPEKCCGMHFFNPPQLMKLVEIVRGTRTSDETIQTVMDVSHKMGKETVLVKKDCPGFIVNRILIPALNEAAVLLWEGIADRDDIDKAIKLGLNWPMGPLTLSDYIGLDTTLDIAEILTRDIDPKFRPCPLLKQMMRAGYLGRKTGKGFYDWTQKK
jgi:3-hydroxybutyryl-CoA dehydrogenase